MKIEVRDDAVLIDGYVNAVERDSKVLRDKRGSFIEKIQAGAFQRSLDRAKKSHYDVKVLLNHDYDRELTSTADSATNIREDSIGLRCTCEIRDADVIQKAKDGKLKGWSFGFISLKDERSADTTPVHREVRELDLREVSILDDTKIPAYDGTSIEIETRDDVIEIRASIENDEIELVDRSTNNSDPIPDLHEWENRYMVTRANRRS